MVGEIGVGVLAFEDGGQVAGVLFARGLAGCGDVFGGLDDRSAGFGVFGEANFDSGLRVGADGLNAEAVREDGVVAHLIDLGDGELEAGCVTSIAVADVDEGLHLVEGHEVLDAVGEMLGDVTGVGGEGLGGIAGLPAALVFEGLGEIPVEEGAVGLDAVGEKLVDEAAVEVDALGVGSAGSVGEDARPGDGEAVGLEAEGLHELHIFFVAMVVVVGDVAGVAVVGLAGSVGEGIPDGDAAAVFFDRAFDLIGGCGRSPEEALGEEVRSRCGGVRIGRGGGSEGGKSGGSEGGGAEELREFTSGKSI